MDSPANSDEIQNQVKRLVDWNYEVLRRLLKQVVAKRIALGKEEWEKEPVLEKSEGNVVLDEVTDVIDLPAYSHTKPLDPDMIELPEEAEDQLHAFVAVVANAYHMNPFHCLQHASAVTMALTKLLSRIVVKELYDIEEEDEDELSDSDDDKGAAVTDSVASHLHYHTYGITSDPLTHFALVLSGFFHEVDHVGLPNSELVKEDPDSASLYKNRSILEQRSVDKVWKKLMEPAFIDLRRCIYSDGAELKRFRQVVVNSVLATDMFDEELQSLRMTRWEKTFSRAAYGAIPDDVNRKATIVIEHLMQAADIFHTMQPWFVYEKWCGRKFEEQLSAFKQGRIQDDPSDTWYQTELDFFDNYAIPLALQLKECGAFVVSNDEFLDYTLRNRQQLSAKGKEMVPAMVAKIEANKSSSVTMQIEPSEGSLFVAGNPDAAERERKATKNKQRLIEWNFEILSRLLKLVVAKREALGKERVILPDSALEIDGDFVDHVTDYIVLPLFDPSVTPDKLDTDSADMGDEVNTQLRNFVSDVSARFNDNSFHGFDRGSQVCTTVRKMLSRISTFVSHGNTESRALDVHNRTFGISSDPLTQFSVVFAALILDIDHPGVPGSELSKEQSTLATKYRNRSGSEQHSLEVAWEHLRQPQFAELRSCIFSDETELTRFRQIITNSVLANDFLDDELTSFRRQRWEKAFGPGRLDTRQENINRKATVVVELLMQASNVFHATQNWHIFEKWNERHFEEMYKAFKRGILTQDPTIFWYKSQLLFFDEQVIPITKQMGECGVFDSSGDEHLSFALANRQRWAAKGGDNVASLVARSLGKEIEKTLAKRAYRRTSLSAPTA